MTIVAAAVLGVVQGLTEFLPVSSSAHLILARAFFGWEPGPHALAFDVAVHAGTLAAIVGYFWRDLLAMASAAPTAFRPTTPAAGRRLQLVAVGTVPIVPAGLLYTETVETALRTPVVAAAMLALVAVLLLVVERTGTGRREETSLGFGEAFGIGVAQALALIPGVSRSGATIALAMALGLRREAAARFAFLLGVPAIAGAAVKEGATLVGAGLAGETAVALGVGVATSAAVGYLTVKYFLRFLSHHRLDAFAYYRLGLAALTLGWLASA